jgi:hypothetical protein
VIIVGDFNMSWSVSGSLPALREHAVMMGLEHATSDSYISRSSGGVDSSIDHILINDHLDFKGVNPTSENVAR